MIAQQYMPVECQDRPVALFPDLRAACPLRAAMPMRPDPFGGPVPPSTVSLNSLHIERFARQEDLSD
jgi:hypothetical protein